MLTTGSTGTATVTATAALGDELRLSSLFADLGEADLAWVAAAGREVRLVAGDVLFAEGETDVAFFVLLEGRLRVTKRIGAEETVLATHEPGAFTGEVPLLTGTPFIASIRALVPSRVFRLDPEPFQEMLARCRGVARTVLQTVAHRLQLVNATLQQQEKLAALGKMAAGLAHELNNPAAAARRAAGSLAEALGRLETLGLELGGAGLDEAELAALVELRRRAQEPGAGDRAAVLALSPLERSDREDALAGWLDGQGMADAWEPAPILVGAGLGADALAPALARLPAAARETAVAWLAAAITAGGLVEEIGQGTGRISELVGAVKRYSYLDQAPEQVVDVREGLESTLTMLGHALKGIALVRDYDPDLPRITAFGSELNQVWTNLIDNAVDAVGGKGRLTVRARRESDRLLVELGDDGPGIAPEVLPRIWEPFFTTKGVGEGTGLGLDIARRIVVDRHHGEIRVESRPGETRFQVRLPLAPAPAASARMADERPAGRRGGAVPGGS